MGMLVLLSGGWLVFIHPDRWATKDRVEAKVDTSQKIEIVTVSPESTDKEDES